MAPSFVQTIQGMEKTARIWSRPMVAGQASPICGEAPEQWVDQFRGTPFLKSAQTLERRASGDRISGAQENLRHAEQRVEDAKFEAKIAGLEQELTDWSFSQEGKDKVAFAEKLAECRYRSFREWSDYFKGSPLYKKAMALEAEDAQREVSRRKRDLNRHDEWRKNDEIAVERAELEAQHAAWRCEQMGMSKTASASLGNAILMEKIARIFGTSLNRDVIASASIPYEERKKVYTSYVGKKSREQPSSIPLSAGVGGGVGAALGALVGAGVGRSGLVTAALLGGAVGAGSGLMLRMADKTEIERSRREASDPSRRATQLNNRIAGIERQERQDRSVRTAAAWSQLLKTSSDRSQPMFPEITVQSFFDEIERIEKTASAASMVTRRGAAGAAALLGTGGAAAGGAIGHRTGREKGRNEGLRVGMFHGYRQGAQRGFQAGQVATVNELKRRMAAAKSKGGKTKKAGAARSYRMMNSALKAFRKGELSPGLQHATEGAVAKTQYRTGPAGIERAMREAGVVKDHNFGPSERLAVLRRVAKGSKSPQ